MKKSSHPSRCNMWRAVTFNPTVAMAMPVKTHPTRCTSVWRLWLKSTSVLVVAIIEGTDQNDHGQGCRGLQRTTGDRMKGPTRG